MNLCTYRRRFLQSAIASGAVAAAGVTLADPAPVTPQSPISDYLDVARKTAAWIRLNALAQPAGIAWPSEPGKPETIGTDIYKGNAGTLLFFLELARATGDKSYLEDVHRAADYLVDRAPAVAGSGFHHDGVAGTAFALAEVWRATGDDRYRRAAVEATERIVSRAQAARSGLTWGVANDVASGDAGTIGYLLYASRVFGREEWREAAAKGGARLREAALKDPGGNFYWQVSPQAKIVMPNFAHGTSGVATVLAQLYTETKRQEFLDGALSGAAHLKSIARSDHETFLLHHHDPDGQNLYYLGVCNGPAGSAQLFYALYKATKNKQWLDITERSAGAILASGIPEQRPDVYPQIPLRVEYSVKPGNLPGFWNNISQCCGAAGIADFLLGLHEATGKPRYLNFARRALDNVVNRAFVDEKGYRWYQSEFRIQPWIIAAQTGYMQGASGVGSALLHLHSALAKDYRALLFPFNPFPRGATRNNA